MTNKLNSKAEKKMTRNLIKMSLILTAGLLLTSSLTFFSKNKAPTKAAVKLTTESNKLPGIVRLETMDGQFFCSGAVISDTEVLTAAHCINPYTRYMVISSINYEGKVEKVNSTAAMFNPRSDTAIVVGNFKNFSKLKFNSNPEDDILLHDYDLAACGFPYAGSLVCYRLTNTFKMVDVIAATGQLYAGMSGGPVIDMATGTIYAINHAVTDQYILIAPIISLKESLFPIPGN